MKSSILFPAASAASLIPSATSPAKTDKHKDTFMQFSAEMIAAGLGGEIVGNKDVTVSTFAKIEEGRAGAISFMANPKYEHYVYTTESTIVIVNRSWEPKEPVRATLIKVDDAYGCFAKLLEMYVAYKPQKSGIHPTAVVAEILHPAVVAVMHEYHKLSQKLCN